MREIMRRADPSGRVLLLGVILSLVFHAGLMEGFARSKGTRGPFGALKPTDEPKPRAATKPEPSRPTPEIRLGKERSSAKDAIAWLGFEEPTEHLAPKGSVDQSPLSPNPGQASAAAPPARTDPLHDPGASAAEQAALNDAMARMGNRVTDVMRDIAPAPTTAAPERRGAEAKPPAPQAAEAAPPGAQEPAKQGSPGLPSEAEAIARAVKESPVVRPGQVVAAQGLEIATRTPRWSKTTLITRRPGNAVVQIAFGRDGTVRSADFVTVRGRRYSTGFDDVDQPLLDAIYTWKAKGEPLRKLPVDDPEAEVKVTLTIMLG